MKKRKRNMRFVSEIIQCAFAALTIALCVIGTAKVITGTKAEAAYIDDSEQQEVVVHEQEFDYVAIYPVTLDSDLQRYIISLCDDYNISPAVVIAVIGQESGYNADAIGDNGNSLGLMQIQPRWQEERMERLGCDDLLDPYQNVTVGIDILAEKIVKYDGNTEMALMSYNAGDTGAYEYWWSNVVYSNDYSKEVMEVAYLLEHGGEV